jgi:tetratricopeptide (TPR) repeat protein
MGNYTQAIRAFRISLELSTKEDILNSQALSLANEAIIHVETGNYKQARNNLTRAIELTSQPWGTPEVNPLRRLSSKCEMHYTFGVLEIQEGNIKAAWEQAKQTLEIAHAVNEPLRFGQANAVIAQVICAYGHAPEESYEDKPDTYFKQAIANYEKIKSERELANIHLIYGNSLASRDENDNAREQYNQAMAIFARLGLPKLAAQAAEARALLGRR